MENYFIYAGGYNDGSTLRSLWKEKVFENIMRENNVSYIITSADDSKSRGNINLALRERINRVREACLKIGEKANIYLFGSCLGGNACLEVSKTILNVKGLFVISPAEDFFKPNELPVETRIVDTMEETGNKYVDDDPYVIYTREFHIEHRFDDERLFEFHVKEWVNHVLYKTEISEDQDLL